MTDTLRGSQIVRTLVAQYAYARRAEPFTLSSGIRSYDYIDGKQVLLVNEFQAQVGSEMALAIRDAGVAYEAVGGLELGAIYVAQALLSHVWLEERTRLASFVVRKKAKPHGKGLRIEGPSIRGKNVVVVDDVVTTGDSLIRAVDAVRSEGALVVLAVTLVDRGDDAAKKLEKMGLPYRALTTYRDYGIDPVSEEEAPVVPQLMELRGLQLPRVDKLPELIGWCWDNADQSGDARYSGIARALDALLDAWDVKTGIPEAIAEEINELLARQLDGILSVPDPASGAAQARRLREEILRLLELGSSVSGPPVTS